MTEKMAEELSDKKLQQLKEQPIVESYVNLSENGEWVVHKTVITDIKSRSYMDKVMAE